jgi:hypothetical protein
MVQKYKVIEKSFVNNMIVEAGDIIEYDGEVSGNLELIPDKVVEKTK